MTDKQEVSVVIDANEAEMFPDIVALVSNHDEVSSYTISRLPAGDLAIEGCLFERKTPSDFAASVTGDERTVFDQAKRMADLVGHDSARAKVLVSGDFEDLMSLKHTQIHPKGLRGAVASIEQRYGVPVHFCSTEEYLVDRAVRMARKTVEEPASNHNPVRTPDDDDLTFAERVYQQIPGVGPVLAEALHHQFTSIPAFLRASREDLKVVDGVGDERAEEIMEYIGEHRPADDKTVETNW